MDYKVVSRDSFDILGMTRAFKAEKSFDDLPKFWAEYFSRGYNKRVAGTMGVCQQERLASEDFRYTIGCEYHQDIEIPDGFGLINIPASTWVVFKCVGPMPGAMQEVLKRIYSEWQPQSEYERIEEYDFEFYTEGDNQSEDYISEIWIPVKRK